MDEKIDQILSRAAKGDEKAWRQIVESYSPRVYGLIYRCCCSSDLAEEITQMTFLKVVAKLSGYREVGRFDAWLFQIAMNTLRDEMRRRNRQGSRADIDRTAPDTMIYDEPTVGMALMVEQERHEQLRQAVGRLPEADQQVLYMRYTSDMSFVQIAEALGQPLGTVLARGHRAIKKLRTLLAEESDEA